MCIKMSTQLTEKNLRSAVVDTVYWSLAKSTKGPYTNAVILFWKLLNFFNAVLLMIITSKIDYYLLISCYSKSSTLLINVRHLGKV